MELRDHSLLIPKGVNEAAYLAAHEMYLNRHKYGYKLMTTVKQNAAVLEEYNRYMEQRLRVIEKEMEVAPGKLAGWWPDGRYAQLHGLIFLRSPLSEDQLTMAQWSLETFGYKTVSDNATRGNVEMAELLWALQDFVADPTPQKMSNVREEAADVAVFLNHVASSTGFDLHRAIEEKMTVNRKRTWGKGTNGKDQHIES